MSKIFEKNLIKETVRGYWKRCVALATAFTHKYKYDLYFRTECRTIALQVLFSGIILLSVIAAFTYLYRDIAISLIQGLQESLSVDTSLTLPQAGAQILGELEYVKTRNLILVILLVVLVTTFFGYIITRLTLKPTRDALSAQKQFIGNIAHELRTPLSTIKTNTEVALLEEGPNGKLTKMLRSNVEELDRISDIINNLLSLSAFVRPERIEFSTVDIGVIVDGVVRKLSALLERRQLQLSLRKSEFRLVWGNQTALEQVITNLLKNAITYTPEGGLINITIEPDYRGYITLMIQDSGIGIAQKDLFRIFEPFYRVDQSRVRRRSGSGLGLTIVNELVKLHHGKIYIKSAVKRGTTVLVSLPCGERPERSATAKLETDEDRRGEIAIDFSHPRGRKDTASAATS